MYLFPSLCFLKASKLFNVLQRCWKCAWLLNCTDTTSSVWMDTKVIYGLKSVVTSKLVDGMAGGCVLSMVSYITYMKIFFKTSVLEKPFDMWLIKV